MGRRWVVLVALVLAACAIAIARAASSSDPNAVSPGTGIQPNGRRLAPPGKLTPIGNHPGGGALTANGHFLWTLSAGRGKNDIRIVRVQPETKRKCRVRHKVRKCHTRKIGRVGDVVQILPMPGVDGGITMSSTGYAVYVSGNKDSDHKDQQVGANVPGREGDVIHVFHYNAWTGRAFRSSVIPVPPPSGSPTPQNFPPTNTKKLSWPRDLALTGDGKTLLAALNLADRAAIIDTRTHAVSPESIFGGGAGGVAAGAPAAGVSPPTAGAGAGGASSARTHGAVMASNSHTLSIILAMLKAPSCLIMPFVLLMPGAGRSLRCARPLHRPRIQAFCVAVRACRP